MISMAEEAVCQVCMHHCRLKPGQWGICRARKNENGEIVCQNYGRLTSLALDPIEKKPLNMFYPGSMILSVGSFGCNLRCPFCQNHEISMVGEETQTHALSPEALLQEALYYREWTGNIGVAFTYNEPLIGWEYVLDTARLLKAHDLKVVIVTNGTLSPALLGELLPFVDAMNIDLKGFRESYYKMLGGSLAAVQEFITMAAEGCHVELTTLVVPGENDDPADMEAEARWIASVSDEIPLHITRFYPRYHMQDRAATDARTIYRLAEVAKRHLKYVFL